MYAHPSRPPVRLLVLGETTWRRQYQRFGLLPEDRLRHLWVLGKTGSGKSTLLANLLAQDMAAGQGLALLDPHGELAQTALSHVPSRRTNEVLYFAPGDHAYPVSFNIFRVGRRPYASSALLASQLVSVFRKHWADFWGPRLEHILRNAILAIASDERATLLFMYRFLTENELREKVVEGVRDPVVRQFWTKEFPSYSAALQAEAMAPVLNKLGAFVSHPVVRNLVSQVRSRVDLVELMERQHILVADLATGQIGEDASHLLGGLLLSALQLAAMTRPRGGPSFIIYADEFQHFVSDSLATMLSESRKFGLGLVLAHQYLDQLPIRLRAAMLGNVGSTVIFRLGAGDAEALAPEFAPGFASHDLQALPRYEMAVKLIANGKALQPFSARSLRPTPVHTDAVANMSRIIEQSRKRYAQPKAEVEEAIAASFAA